MTRSMRVCLVLAALLGAVRSTATDRRGGSRWCGTYAGATRDALWAHREAGLHGEARALPAAATLARTAAARADVGEIAVIEDQGDLMLRPNLMDLQRAGLEFAPQGAEYRLARVDRPVGAEAGTVLGLADDASVVVPLPFAFPFYGESRTEVYVNSDGNLTFGAGDSASTPRSLGRFLEGPPRIAPLFADLDPSAGGSVSTIAQADRFVVRWTDVPQWGERDGNTFEVALRPDGRVEFAYGPSVNRSIAEGVVGIAPGRSQGGVALVDLSSSPATGAGAIAETFRAESELDIVAIARRFYQTHGDDYQQLVVFTNRQAGGRRGGYFAYELGIKNQDAGIGVEAMDFTAEFGSAGHLESFVMMEFVGKYGTDVSAPLLGETSALSVLGQEVGHRWLARAVFLEGDKVSDELLGRDRAHWSFYLDTDGSHLEGNEIADLGGGQFRTGKPTVRYSPLDQYLMGYRPAEEVPPFFFVRTGQDFGADRAPESGVTLAGTRRDVTIGDVIAALGSRNPPPGPRDPFRQAFVLVSLGEAPNPTWIDRAERFRQAWEPFFAQSMDGRGTVDTHLSR